MHTERRFTKAEERKFLADHARDRAEQERQLPAEQQHAIPDWIAQFWRRVAS